ncbi:hypothetical protein [Paenibacillus glucanolyticus]|uniref:hypothetical protein n=1 Tax=Paenibacillus glucanolyticus TaxID=59843 RepID=UPI00096FA2D2|nr:hypothetical protein [Paenibacillus glucanolyticus]OMF76781.1 hypothetical protein BK142_14780 [Paenibacillus glucanolyticus]
MSKDFAMLAAVKRLDQYFLREFGRLDDEIHADDPAVQDERSIRISELNELSVTLNELFGALTDSPESKLFPTYQEQKGEFDHRVQSQTAESADLAESKSEDVKERVDEDAKQDQWSNPSEIRYTTPAQQRIDRILKEYKETAPRDIARHLPEDYRPFEMLYGISEAAAVGEFDNHDVKHPAEVIPLDDNGVQTAAVIPGAEKGAEEVCQGTDIDLSSYLTRRSSPILTVEMMEADIRKLRLDHVEDRQAVDME